jgi:predicted ATPase with chaperone activity
MIGSPGTGEPMLAQRLPTILPPLGPAESLETTRIFSATGRLPSDHPLLTGRPYRSSHHTISDAGVVGGGNPPAPGEIGLAHQGVFFRSFTRLTEFCRIGLTEKEFHTPQGGTMGRERRQHEGRGQPHVQIDP